MQVEISAKLKNHLKVNSVGLYNGYMSFLENPAWLKVAQ